MSLVTQTKMFRVYCEYKSWTEKGGSGYDILVGKDEIFEQFDFWRELINPLKILVLDYGLISNISSNGRPYFWLDVIYQVERKEDIENFEDIIRRIQELKDWELIDSDVKIKLKNILEDFLTKDSISELRKKWLSVAKEVKENRMKEIEENRRAE